MTKKLKSKQRIEDAIEGKIPFEDLTDKELKKLERLVFRAVAEKRGASVIPQSNTRH